MSNFPDAILKLDRADQHITELDAAIRLFENSNRPVTKVNPQNNRQFAEYGFIDLDFRLKQFACISGDAIHNLRASLDFSWIAILEKKNIPFDRNYVKFPVRKTAEEVEVALKGLGIEARCPELHKFIMEEMQPYHGGKIDAIRVLHDLDVADKHLLLLTCDPYSSIEKGRIVKTNGEVEEFSTFGFTPKDRPIRIEHWDDEVSFEHEGVFSLAIMIKEAGVFSGLHIVEALKTLSKFCRHHINKLSAI